MLLHVTDHEAEYELRAPFRWPQHPGSKLHHLLKAALHRIDRDVARQLLAPIVPDPAPHFSLRPGDPAPAALIPVLRPPGEDGPRGLLEPGATVRFGLRRFGRAARSVDVAIADALETLHPALAPVRLARAGLRERPLEIAEHADTQGTVTLRFLTPGHLAKRKRVTEDMTFATLAKHARRRLEALCALHGELPPGTTGHFRDTLLLRAAEVTRTRQALRVARWARMSSRQGTQTSRHPMFGLVGEVEYQGPVGACLPTLRAVEQIHLGKLTSMGLGRVRVHHACCRRLESA